jgi:hypothetical protein
MAQPTIRKARPKKEPKTKLKKGNQDQLLFPDSIRQGKDEMNLATFPMAALYTHIPEGTRFLKFEDTIVGKNGKLVKRTWTIQGGSEVGLPTATDEDVYVALMELTQRQSFENQQVFFSRYDLLNRLGWCICGKCYARLEASLKRLSSVSIHAHNAFWDNEKKSYVTAGFTLIQGFHMYYEAAGRKTDRDQPSSWITWSDQLYQSFKSGYIKFLDTELYFALQTSTARRLYRFLDKKFGDGTEVTIDLFKLAHEHLGLSRSFQYPSEVIRQLTPALQEMIEKGYLTRWAVKDHSIRFVKSATARHQPFERVDEQLYQTIDLPSDSVRVVEDTMPEPSKRILDLLIKRGVTRKQATKLVESNMARLDSVELSIKYFDSLMAAGKNRIKNPGGFLVSLINEGDVEAAAEKVQAEKSDARVQSLLQEMAYREYVEKQIDQGIAALPPGQFEESVKAKKAEFLNSEKAPEYRRWAAGAFEDFAVTFCRKDIEARLTLPGFETWLQQTSA